MYMTILIGLGCQMKHDDSATVLIAEQEWRENEDGWHECGWFITVDDAEREVHESTFELVEVLDRDKYYHPIKASFRKRAV